MYSFNGSGGSIHYLTTLGIANSTSIITLPGPPDAKPASNPSAISFLRHFSNRYTEEQMEAGKKLAKEFRPRFEPLDLMNLANRDFYLKLMIDGAPCQPFSARTLDAEA